MKLPIQSRSSTDFDKSAHQELWYDRNRILVYHSYFAKSLQGHSLIIWLWGKMVEKNPSVDHHCHSAPVNCNPHPTPLLSSRERLGPTCGRARLLSQNNKFVCDFCSKETGCTEYWSNHIIAWSNGSGDAFGVRRYCVFKQFTCFERSIIMLWLFGLLR